MADTFLEFMVRKRSTPKDILIKLGVILACVVVVMAVMLFSPMLGAFSMFGYLLAAGAIYGAYRLIIMQNLEYEYVITNGDLDVDKIINRNGRKRILSVKCASFETFGQYNAQEHQGGNYKTRMFACTSPADSGLWYATFNHASLGRTLLVINADNRMIEAFKKFIPKQLAYEVFVKRPMK